MLDKPKRECYYFISRIFQHSLLLSANNTENDLRRNRYEVSTLGDRVVLKQGVLRGDYKVRNRDPRTV